MKRKKKEHAKPKAIVHQHAEMRSVEVENPYFSADHAESSANAKRINAAINVRESAIETLYARKFLALSQKRAADRFREIWESAGGKSASLDYTLDKVDGGRGDPIVSRLHAAQELQRCRRLLGVRGYETVQAVCAEGKALDMLTPHKRERLTMADNLRADLDDLATMWHMQTKRRSAANAGHSQQKQA